MRSTRKGRKRLKSKSSCQSTRCVMAALMSIGGGQGILPAVAAAQETTINTDMTGFDVVGNNDGSNYHTPTEVASVNTITIASGGVVDNVHGGQGITNQNANQNNVIIEGTCNVNAVGGQTNSNGSTNLNNVTVESTGIVGGNVSGGSSENGPADVNTVEIKGNVTGDVYGGLSTNGDTNENVITVDGGTIGGTTFGGWNTNGNAIKNEVTLMSGSVNYFGGGRATSASSTAENNKVHVYGGTANILVGGDTTSGIAQNNTINIHDGTVLFAWGGIAQGTGTVNENTVNVRGGKITDVSGGLGGGDAIGNTVNLYDLDGISDYINGTIQGGKAGAGKTSADNTVNFLGTAYLPNATLDGSTIQNLNVYTTSNSVKDITGNIGNMHFYLPANISNGDTMLTVSNGIETNLDNTTINWSSASMPNLSDGEKVTLIYNANNLSTNGTILPGPRSYLRATGISSDTTYTFTTEREDTKAIVIRTSTKTTTGDGVTLPARTRSLVETRTAMTSLLSGGSDFVATQVMDEAEAVAIDPEISVVYGRLVPFAVFGGGYLNLDSGADVDLNSYYVNLGLTKEIKNRNGSLYLGPIFEYGHGSYDSYLDSGIHGWGKGHYVGGGFFARQRNHDGFYYEGDLRAGRFKSDYQGNLAEGLNANYTTEGSYIAAHLGLGKVFKLNQTDTMDTYLKYFFSRTSGDDVNIHSNLNEEMFNFDSVNSHRLRIGARYYHPMNKSSRFYAGLAYQYEFGGEASATHDGLCTPAPSLRGSSGMAELGLKVTSGKKVPMTLDLGVSGWVGKQKGVMGRLKLSWAF